MPKCNGELGWKQFSSDSERCQKCGWWTNIWNRHEHTTEDAVTQKKFDDKFAAEAIEKYRQMREAAGKKPE